MKTLEASGPYPASRPLRRFWLLTMLVCAMLASAGFILARQFSFAAGIAVPVVAAFCWQAALYCAAVSPAARRAVRAAFGRLTLAALLVAASVAPYLLYSVPTGLFSWASALKLAALCALVAFPYALWRAPERRLGWQDAMVICALSYPMISGLSTLFRDVYQGFEPPAHRLDALGKLMLIPLGLYVFLALRRLDQAGLRLVPTREDFRTALACSAHAMPWVALVGIVTGYLQWDPPVGRVLAALAASVGKLVGIYFTTALAEEFLLRGVVQNLFARSTGKPLLAQGVSAVLFGAAHLGRGGFPNLPYAATAAVLGWFCGMAYNRSRSVTPAMLTHALAVAGQELLFL